VIVVAVHSDSDDSDGSDGCDNNMASGDNWGDSGGVIKNGCDTLIANRNGVFTFRPQEIICVKRPSIFSQHIFSGEVTKCVIQRILVPLHTCKRPRRDWLCHLKFDSTI
jgi:hypothetical protein